MYIRKAYWYFVFAIWKTIQEALANKSYSFGMEIIGPLYGIIVNRMWIKNKYIIWAVFEVVSIRSLLMDLNSVSSSILWWNEIIRTIQDWRKWEWTKRMNCLWYNNLRFCFRNYMYHDFSVEWIDQENRISIVNHHYPNHFIYPVKFFSFTLNVKEKGDLTISLSLIIFIINHSIH